MNFGMTHDYLVAEGDLYARHLAIGERTRHPTGECTPVSEAERTLTPLHRWERIAQRWRGAPRALLPRAVTPQTASGDADALNGRGDVAQQRYYELLTRFTPNHSYAHPATAIFTQEYASYQPVWSELIPQLAVTMVVGQLNDYLRVSGEEVAQELRALIAAAQA